jgi:hypothetical protein
MPGIPTARCTTPSELRATDASDKRTISIVTASTAVQFNAVYLPLPSNAFGERLRSGR